MGIDSFWSDINVEPKRSFNWIMLIGGIPQWVIKKTKKPSYKITEAKHVYINHTFKYPGRVEWDPLDVTLVDPLTPDATRTIEDIIANSGYRRPTNANDIQTISKRAAVEALGNVNIIQIDADGNTIDAFELINPWIMEVSYGELDYTKDDLVEITLKINFDYAQMVESGQAVLPANE